MSYEIKDLKEDLTEKLKDIKYIKLYFKKFKKHKLPILNLSMTSKLFSLVLSNIDLEYDMDSYNLTKEIPELTTLNVKKNIRIFIYNDKKELYSTTNDCSINSLTRDVFLDKDMVRCIKLEIHDLYKKIVKRKSFEDDEDIELLKYNIIRFIVKNKDKDILHKIETFIKY